MKRNFVLVIIVIIVAVVFAFFNYRSSSTDEESQNNYIGESYNKEEINNLKHIENFLPNAIKHIFFGTINTNGEAEGFHYANIKDSSSHIIKGTKTKDNSAGVYKAKVIIDGIPKSDDGGYSTFFPNSLSPQMIVNSINEAYNHKKHIAGNIYVGKAFNHIEIEMYLTNDGKIISAFPRY